ncbi:hypothetical protein [Streptomyces sp. HUAS ZL42]|uniref:hypothetical protein n=1 Tax=Streptomyces sp. HUAS ZL42 TaxID=3231715 RepID=UPI00345EAB92
MTPPTVSVPPPGGLWLRAARLLARLRRGPAPARPSRAAQVRALAVLLDEVVAAQRPVDLAVAACGEPGPVSCQAAQEAGRQSVVLHRLRGRVGELDVTDADLVEAQAYAGRLLAYDQWMVRQALDLAFTVHRDPRVEAARLRINGLGRPADELRRLRDSVRAQVDVGGP